MTYSVLAVSAAEKLNTVISSMLSDSGCAPIRFTSSVGEAKRIWSGQEFDFLIINSPLPDDTGLRFAIDSAASRGSVVLLLTRAEIYDDIYEKLCPHGVFVLAKPLSRQSLATALDWMASARERLRKLEQKTISVEEKMEEIRLVNRAKWRLIEQRGMDEPTAHRYIEKQAMDRCVTRRAVAEEILSG